MSMPNSIMSTSASLGVSEASALLMFSFRLSAVTISSGSVMLLSSMKLPRGESRSASLNRSPAGIGLSGSFSSSRTGVSSDTGSLAILRRFRIFSSDIHIFCESSFGVGSRPKSCNIRMETRLSLLMVSIMCTGILMVLA